MGATTPSIAAGQPAPNSPLACAAVQPTITLGGSERPLRLAALLVSLTTATFAQKWEFGAEGGGGFLNIVNVTGSAGSATAGFAPGFVVGAF